MNAIEQQLAQDILSREYYEGSHVFSTEIANDKYDVYFNVSYTYNRLGWSILDSIDITYLDGDADKSEVQRIIDAEVKAQYKY